MRVKLLDGLRLQGLRLRERDCGGEREMSIRAR